MPIVVLFAAGALWVWSDIRQSDVTQRLTETFTALSDTACSGAAPQAAEVRWAMPVVAAAWASRVHQLCGDDAIRIAVEPAPAGESIQHVRFTSGSHAGFEIDVRMDADDAVPLVTAVRDL